MYIDSLSPSAKQKLEHLCTIFKEKNKHINLSSLRDKETIWEKHILDSLSAIPLLQNIEPKTVVDMGTGGGFPTLPLAICFPEIQFFPLDSVQKKLKCVAEFAEQLSLSNVHPLHGRAEEHAHQKLHRGQYDMVLTRAFANFSPMLEMTLPFLKEKGTLISYRGPENNLAEDDLLLDHFGGFCKKVHVYTLPKGEKRELWEIVKVEPTEKKYPRKTGTPKKEPISFEQE